VLRRLDSFYSSLSDAVAYRKDMNTSARKSTQAFTIVELLIVIVVIGILATIVTVGYGQIKKSALNNVVRSTLASTAKKFEVDKQSSGSYPIGAFPSGISAPSGMGMALSGTSSATEFCINGTAQSYSDIQWYVDQTLSIKSGLCPGTVIAASIIGDYNSSGASVGFVVPPKARTVQGTGEFALKVQIPEAWDQVTISWTPPAGMATSSTFELATRTSSTGSWYFHNRADGTSDYASANYAYNSRTFLMPYSTTSLTWATQMPKGAGADYEYRIRYKTSADVFSEWDTVALGNPVQSIADAPDGVKNFKITPASDWSTATLSWDQLPAFLITMTDVTYEVQSRTSATGSWYYHNRDGTSDYVGPNYSYSNRSYLIPYNTTSMTWTTKFPSAAGQHHEYEIRYYLQGQINSYSDWSVITLER